MADRTRQHRHGAPPLVSSFSNNSNNSHGSGHSHGSSSHGSSEFLRGLPSLKVNLSHDSLLSGPSGSAGGSRMSEDRFAFINSSPVVRRSRLQIFDVPDRYSPKSLEGRSSRSGRSDADYLGLDFMKNSLNFGSDLREVSHSLPAQETKVPDIAIDKVLKEQEEADSVDADSKVVSNANSPAVSSRSETISSSRGGTATPAMSRQASHASTASNGNRSTIHSQSQSRRGSRLESDHDGVLMSREQRGRSGSAAIIDQPMDASQEKEEPPPSGLGVERENDDLSSVFYDYFGAESRVGFVEKSRQSYGHVNRYMKEEDLPASAASAIPLYLREIAKAKILPMSCGVLRKEKNPKGVFLSHKGLGDVKLLPVINVLDKLPCVETIDLCDNRLTDASLMPLSVKLNSLRSLTHLDLSFNKIDDSSETIMEFLRSETCPLRTLLLNGADVDDGESVNLFEAIAQNKSLHTLGLSNNLIGNTEMESQTHPDMRTGGMALREMLSQNNTLTKLDISWNCIRLKSSVEIGAALQVNSSLKSLNISHNAFGDIGTQMLGKALKRNKTIEELDIQSNSLSPKSATVLANGLFYNESMKLLKIDGNILGVVGTQAIVAAIQRSAFGDEPRQLQVSFNNCDCRKVVPGLFNAASPGGVWEVDLAEPYGQMVAEECFFLANNRAGCNIATLSYNGRNVPLDRAESTDIRKKNFSLEDFYKNSRNASSDVIEDRIQSASVWMKQLLHQFEFYMQDPMRISVLEKVRTNWFMKTSKAERNELSEVFLFEVFFALFVINDVDNSGTMEIHEFIKTLEMLGKRNVDKDFAKRLMAEHDKDDSGTIDANEFAMIMVNEFCRTDLPKGVVIDKNTREPWIIPETGKVVIKMIYECDAPSIFDIGKDEGIYAVIRAIQEAKTVDQKEIIFEQATASPYYFLSAEQGQMLYDEVISIPSLSQMDVIAAILPQLVNDEQVCRFLDNNLDDFGKLALRVRLGNLYNAYIGIPTGHYSIELKLHEQLQGGRRLSSIAVAESKFLKQLNVDTSQKGNRSNFRNEMIGSVEFKPVEIHGSWFANCPRSGVLRFDYVSTQRPRQGTRSISQHRFERILEILNLSEIMEEINRLRQEEEELKAENIPDIIDSAEVLNIDNGDENNVDGDMEGNRTRGNSVALSDYDFSPLNDLEKLILEGEKLQDESLKALEAQTQMALTEDVVARRGSIAESDKASSCPRSRLASMNADELGSLPDISKAEGGPSLPRPKTNATGSRGGTARSYSTYVEAPLTAVFVKDHFFEYMDTCHHYWDIYPKEKLRDVSRATYDVNKPLTTPPEMDIRPHPPRDDMPIYYPFVIRKLLQLTILLPGIYFSCEQVAALLKMFPRECYFRIQVLQTVFSRIVDLENFDLIYDKIFDEDERREALHRLGIMNLLDPFKVDRFYCLDLRRMEHREMCKILIALAVAEPGENWVDEHYRWAKYDDAVPGWVLPATWAMDDSENNNDGGPRRHGWITLRYRSEGFGCAPVWEVRKTLRRRFLVGLKRIL